MKILYIINSLAVGGAERLVVQLATQLKLKKNVFPEVLVFQDKDSPFYNDLFEAGITVHSLNLTNPRSPLALPSLLSFLRKNNYDVVHVHLWPALYWVSLANHLHMLSKTQLIYTEHNTTNRRRTYHFLKPIERFFYSSYQKVIAISPTVRSCLEEWLGGKDNIITIYNGVPVHLFSEAAPLHRKDISSNIPEHAYLLCMVGRFSSAKDQQTIIRSLPILPKTVHAIFVGSGDETSARDISEKLGVANRIHFLGNRSDVPSILKAVDIVIQSSHWEGLPLSPLEGMAAGKPTVASDVPGMKEVVLNAGVFFKSQDEKELAEIVLKLLKDSSYYSDVARLCKKRADKYDISKMISHHYELYQKLLS